MRITITERQIVITPASYRVEISKMSDRHLFRGDGFPPISGEWLYSDILDWLKTTDPLHEIFYHAGDFGEGPPAATIIFSQREFPEKFMDAFENYRAK